jgi:hypothetical protein
LHLFFGRYGIHGEEIVDADLALVLRLAWGPQNSHVQRLLWWRPVAQWDRHHIRQVIGVILPVVVLGLIWSLILMQNLRSFPMNYLAVSGIVGALVALATVAAELDLMSI